MTITTVAASGIGMFATSNGYYRRRGPDGLEHLECCAADDYQPLQPHPLDVTLDHDLPIGHVQYLERDQSGLLAVFTIDDERMPFDELRDGVWFLSPGWRARSVGSMAATRARLDEIAIVRSPATVGLPPVRFAGGIDITCTAGAAPHDLPINWHPIWENAHQYATTHRRTRSGAMPITNTPSRTTEPDRPQPATPARAPITRRQAADEAAMLGVAGYSYIDRGTRVLVRTYP